MNFQRFTSLALAGCFVVGIALLDSDLSLGDPDSGLLLYLWLAATVILLIRLLTPAGPIGALWRTLRLLGVVLLGLALVPGVLAVMAKGILEHKAAAVECENQRRYVAMHSGGFGSTWFDVIEMKRVLPMVYTTRALKQYERETVEELRCLSGRGVEVRLGEYGKPERTELLGL